MEKEAELTKNYQKKRTELEEQEELVKQTMKRAQEYSQDIWEQLNHLVRKKDRSMDSLMEVRQKLQRNEANYIEELSDERKNLRDQQEEVDQIYRKNRQELKK